MLERTFFVRNGPALEHRRCTAGRTRQYGCRTEAVAAAGDFLSFHTTGWHAPRAPGTFLLPLLVYGRRE